MCSVKLPRHQIVGPDALASLRAEVEDELADAARWGTTFTLIQACGRVPG